MFTISQDKNVSVSFFLSIVPACAFSSWVVHGPVFCIRLSKEKEGKRKRGKAETRDGRKEDKRKRR